MKRGERPQNKKKIMKIMLLLKQIEIKINCFFLLLEIAFYHCFSHQEPVLMAQAKTVHPAMLYIVLVAKIDII